MVSPEEVEGFLRTAFGFPPDTELRAEDRRKALQVAALLGEIERVARGGRERTLVDLGCGHAYVGLAAAALLGGARLHVTGVDREPARIRRCEEAAARLGVKADLRVGEIGVTPIPPEPDIVVALHACGRATDDAIGSATSAAARHVLLVPCCHRGGELRVPRLGVLEALRRRAEEDIARARRLETAGYEVVATEIWPASVSPANVLLRARRTTSAVTRTAPG